MIVACPRHEGEIHVLSSYVFVTSRHLLASSQLVSSALDCFFAFFQELCLGELNPSAQLEQLDLPCCDMYLGAVCSLQIAAYIRDKRRVEVVLASLCLDPGWLLNAIHQLGYQYFT